MHLGNPVRAALARARKSAFARVRLAAAAGVAALSFMAAPAPADEAPAADPAAGHAAGMSEEERDRQAEAISRSIMSPFCPGRTVSSCPNAGPWRDDIRKWVGEGVDAAEIKRRLAERVPEHNLAGVPGNRLGWVLPIGLGIGAFGLLVFLLRYLVARPAGATEKAPGEGAGAKAGSGNSADGGASPAGAAKNGKDWDAQLDRELETLENN